MDTLPEFLFEKIRLMPEQPAYTWWNRTAWQTLSWREFGIRVAHSARQLEQAGVMPGDRVVLVSPNCVEWPELDLAIQVTGAVSVPLSPLMTGPQIGSLLEHCQPALMIVADQEKASKLPNPANRNSAREDGTGREPEPAGQGNSQDFRGTPTARHQDSSDQPAAPPTSQPGLPLWILAERNDSREQAGDVHDQARAIEWMMQTSRVRLRPDSLVSILYTSGTTGIPKGVMLSQSNLVSNALAKVRTLALGPEDVRLCWLPMSHIFSRLADLATGWWSGCHSVISRGRDHLFGELQQFRPTYLNGVPWFYDKCCRLIDNPGGLRELLGGRIRLCNCGGAPLPQHVLDIFAAGGVCLVNGYGLTEASPVVSSNSPTANRPGSVGRAVPGVELRVSGEGTLLVRGPNVMQGYYRDPEGTRQTLRDGWLDTGDLAAIDSDGFVWITGRKKELIVTMTGRNIAPVAIEHRLLADPRFLQVLVVGDQRNFLVALVVPNREHPEVQALWSGDPDGRGPLEHLLMEQVSRLLADLAPYEQIAGLLLVDQPFSVENGMATPKQSLRRDRIAAHFATGIDDLYRRLTPDRSGRG